VNTLITKSLGLQDTSYLLPFKPVLMNVVEQKWVAWIHDYIVRYGAPPTLERFSKEFATNFEPVPSADPLRDIFDQTLLAKRNVHVRAEISKNAVGLRDGADPSGIIQKLYEDISGVDTACIDTSTLDKSAYFRIPDSMLTNIGGLDELIGGIVRGDLVWIAGRPGDGKTTLLLMMIAKWFWEGKKILLISNEIPYLDMLFKLDAIWANLRISEKRLGQWGPESKEKLRFLQYVQRIAPGKVVVPTGPIRKPDSLRGLIEEHKPDIVCIDGAYMMSVSGKATSEWAELATVSRELKQMANSLEVPIVGVLQANRDSEFRQTTTVGALAGTDAYGQDADTVILLRSSAIVGGDKEVHLHVSKNRNGVVGTIVIRYDFTRMAMYEATV
jgi:hypothetical protein